jgi:hypothetical protein
MENAADMAALEKPGKPSAPGVQKASKLNGAIFESGNKDNLFNIATGTGKYSISFSEAARWLLHVICFDDGGIKLYIKGKMSQQITYCVPATCTRGLDANLIKKIFRPGNVTVFPVQLFNYMKGIGGDYDIDITYAVFQGVEQMSLKATSLVPGVNPDKPMTLWMGAAECSAAAHSQFDLVQ